MDHHDFQQIRSAAAISGEVRETSANNNAVTLNFEGSGVDFISSKGIGGAKVMVYLNDAYMTDVPQSSLATESAAHAFSSTNAQALATGANKPTIYKNRDSLMNVDAFRIYKEPTSPSLV